MIHTTKKHDDIVHGARMEMENMDGLVTKVLYKYKLSYSYKIIIIIKYGYVRCNK